MWAKIRGLNPRDTPPAIPRQWTCWAWHSKSDGSAAGQRCGAPIGIGPRWLGRGLVHLLVSQLFFGASVQVGMTLSLHTRIIYIYIFSLYLMMYHDEIPCIWPQQLWFLMGFSRAPNCEPVNHWFSLSWQWGNSCMEEIQLILLMEEILFWMYGWMFGETTNFHQVWLPWSHPTHRQTYYIRGCFWYCWWFRNPAFTSWGKGSLSQCLQGFSTIPGGCLGFLNHQH